MIRHIYKIMIAIVCCLLAIPSEAQTKAEKNGYAKINLLITAKYDKTYL